MVMPHASVSSRNSIEIRVHAMRGLPPKCSGSATTHFTAATRLDLLAELRPVVEELLEPDVRQRVLHELLEHRERHRRHMRARLRRVHHVTRVANRRGEARRLESLD